MPPSVFVIRVKQPTTITYAHCEHFTTDGPLLRLWVQHRGEWGISGGKAIVPLLGSSLADTFTRTNSTITMNPPSDGGEWYTEAGTWGITSNKAYMPLATPNHSTDGSIPTVANNQQIARRNLGYNAADVTVTNTRADTSSSSAVWVAYDPETLSGYMALFDSSSSFGGIYRVVNGVLGSAVASLSLTTWTGASTTLHMTHDGAGVVKVYQGGTLKQTYTDTSPLTTGTWVGVSANLGNANTDQWSAFSATGSGTPRQTFGLSRPFARYPVGVGAIDLSVAWAKASSAMAGTNLLTRNQFGLEGGPGGWQGYDIDPVIAASTDYAYSGTYSLRIGSTTGSGSPGATTLTGTSGFPVTPGRSYGASFRARANYALGVLTSIRWWNSSGTQIGSEVVGNPTSAYSRGGVSQTSWGSYYDDTMLFTAPSGAAFASLQLNLTNSNVASASLCYFDEIGMYDLTTPTMLFNSTVISSDRSIVFAYDPSSDTGFSLDANDIPESAWPTVANTVRAFTDGTTTRVLSYKLTTGTKIVNLRCTGSGYDHYTYYVSGDVSGGRAIFESSAYVPSHTDVAGTTTSSFGVYLRDLNGNFLGSGSIQDSVIQPSYTSTINLIQHNGSTATTLATATVTSFTSATFEVVYYDGPGTIVVKQNGSTIISIDLDTVAGGPYPHMTGVWAGLMTDAANADQWDEFCWTLSPTTGSATGPVRVTYSTADVLIQNTPAVRVTYSTADTLVSNPPAARVTYSTADVLIT